MTDTKRGRTRRFPDRSSHRVDRQVALRIRDRREALGISQASLAAAIGVSYQQVQKYESGRNRITAGRLHEIAEVLGVPVERLFGSADDCAQVSGEFR